MTRYQQPLTRQQIEALPLDERRAYLRGLDQHRFDTIGLPAPTPAVVGDYLVGRHADRTLGGVQ